MQEIRDAWAEASKPKNAIDLSTIPHSVIVRALMASDLSSRCSDFTLVRSSVREIVSRRGAVFGAHSVAMQDHAWWKAILYLFQALDWQPLMNAPDKGVALLEVLDNILSLVDCTNDVYTPSDSSPMQACIEHFNGSIMASIIAESQLRTVMHTIVRIHKPSLPYGLRLLPHDFLFARPSDTFESSDPVMEILRAFEYGRTSDKECILAWMRETMPAEYLLRETALQVGGGEHDDEEPKVKIRFHYIVDCVVIPQRCPSLLECMVEIISRSMDCLTEWIVLRQKEHAVFQLTNWTAEQHRSGKKSIYTGVTLVDMLEPHPELLALIPQPTLAKRV